MLLLVFLLLLPAFSVIAVRGFSIIPKTIRVGMNAIPAANTLPVDESDLIYGDKHKTTLIQRTTSTTTTLFAGLFGEQTKAKNQNNTYVSSTSVSDSRICFLTSFISEVSWTLLYFVPLHARSFGLFSISSSPCISAFQKSLTHPRIGKSTSINHDLRLIVVGKQSLTLSTACAIHRLTMTMTVAMKASRSR